MADAPADIISLPEVNPQAALTRYEPEARALPAEQVVSCRGDLHRALYNVRVGVTAVLHRADEVAHALPEADLAELRALPELAMAVLFAEQIRAQSAPGGTGAAELIPRVRASRRTLLTAARAAAGAGLLPAQAVTAIARGRGLVDAANDCVALAALFTDHADALRGRTAITAEQITAAREQGSRLLGLLRPSDARPDMTARATLRGATDLRDRLWTLLTQRHERAWRIGAWLFGRDEVDVRIPALAGRTRAAHRAANDGQNTAAPTPAAPTAPAPQH